MGSNNENSVIACNDSHACYDLACIHDVPTIPPWYLTKYVMLTPWYITNYVVQAQWNLSKQFFAYICGTTTNTNTDPDIENGTGVIPTVKDGQEDDDESTQNSSENKVVTPLGNPENENSEENQRKDSDPKEVELPYEDYSVHLETEKHSTHAPKIHGIEGSNNSCYMDSSLNSMFLFSTAFQRVLEKRCDELSSSPQQTLNNEKETQKMVNDGNEVLNVLLNEIAKPLNDKKILELSSQTILKFRELLSTLNENYLGNEMDPEEFISTLFLTILNTQGFYKIDGDSEGSYVFQTYADMTESQKETNVQRLLEYSFADSDIKLASIPSPGFIIKMPVTDGRHMFSKIYPNVTIDLHQILANNAGENNKMLLTAVICLAGHHYTAFVRDGNEMNSAWWYLDSFSFSGAESFPDFDKTLEKLKCSQRNERLAFLISQCYMCFYLPMTTEIEDTRL